MYKMQSPIPNILKKKDGLFLYGHRGLSQHKHENTIKSFKYAIDCNMDGIELDIQKSLDGKLIIYHDETLKKITGDMTPISKLNFSDINNVNLMSNEDGNHYIPELIDVINIIPKYMMLNIEIKYYKSSQKTIIEDALHLFDKYDLYQNTIISSFNPFILRAIKKRNINIPIALIWDGKLKFIKTWLKLLKPSAFHMHIDFIDNGIIPWIHSRNIKVYIYTVNSKNDYEKVIQHKVDGVFTDVNSFNK